MGLDQFKNMTKFNSSKTESLNKGPNLINNDIVKAHVGCIMEDLEPWPAEEAARQWGNQRYLTGATVVNCEGVKVSRGKEEAVTKLN